MNIKNWKNASKIIDSRCLIILRLFWKTLTAILRRRENCKNVSKFIWLLFLIFIGKFHWKFLFFREKGCDLPFPEYCKRSFSMILKVSFFFILFLPHLQSKLQRQWQQECIQIYFLIRTTVLRYHGVRGPGWPAKTFRLQCD